MARLDETIKREEAVGAVVVTNQNKARHVKRRFDAVLTIEDPRRRQPLRFHRTPHPEHLVLRFEDVDFERADLAMPQPEHMRAALEFGREHAAGDLLVHCSAGVARSTAIALMLLADRLGPGMEEDAVATLLDIRPVAAPNLVMLAMADRILERDGALVAAWMTHEDADPELAQHRADKLEILKKYPERFAYAPAGLGGTILRFSRSAITPVRLSPSTFSDPDLGKLDPVVVA